MKSKVFALGSSNAIRIPRFMMDALSLSADDPITIEVNPDSEMGIKKQNRREVYPSIHELFSGYTGNAKPVEMDSHGTVGRELI